MTTLQTMNERLANALRVARTIPHPPVPSSRRRKLTPAQQARQSEITATRRAHDPGFRLAGNLRSRLHMALKSNVIEGPKTAAMVGCSVPKLREYIQSLWKPGMTWENYGSEWCIDHIQPCSSFDLLDPEQLAACFHFTNLQPLFVLENQRKGAKQCAPAWW